MSDEKTYSQEVLRLAAQDLGISEQFLVHALTPLNVGIIPNADGKSNPTGSCGDSIELYLRIEGGKVSDARFLTDGCMHTVACGSALTGLVKGMELDQAAKVGFLEVEEAVGGLPEDHRHCASLAAQALEEAIADYRAKQG